MTFTHMLKIILQQLSKEFQRYKNRRSLMILESKGSQKAKRKPETPVFTRLSGIFIVIQTQ